MADILSFRRVRAVTTSSDATFPATVATALREDAGRPLVTFYDDATGERVELSVTTYANWVAKTANLLQDELDVERGARVLVDLPTHWLGAVWLGACWTVGVAVTTDVTEAPAVDLVVCGPDRPGEHAERSAPGAPVVALSLRPLGARFVDPLPEGVLDYGAVVLAQPDAFVAHDPVAADDAAWQREGTTLSQQQLLREAAEAPLFEPRGRLLTDLNPCSPEGVGTLLSPQLLGGGTVWVAHPDPAGWQRRYEQERATALLQATSS
jgi:uncharacterized protein (TIGR03089 family)